MTTISASEARQTLPAQLDAVERGEEVRITRHGKVVAVLVSPTRITNPHALAAIARAEELGRELDAARNRPLSTGGMSIERAEELVAQIRADRDSD